MQTEKDAAVIEDILDETPEPVAEEQADIAATAEKETESPEENGTPSAGDPEQEDQESDSEEATNEPSEEAPEAPDNEDEDAKAQVKSRTKKRIDTLLTKTKEKEAEIERLRGLLTKQSQPAPQDTPKTPDFSAEESQAAAEYNKAVQDGTSEAEQMRLYQRWLGAREKRVVEQAKRETLEYFHNQQRAAQATAANNYLQEEALDIHAEHPFLKQTEQGVQVDVNAPIIRKAQEIAGRMGVPLEWGPIGLNILRRAQRELGSPVVNRAKKAENRVKEITERTGIEPGHRAPAPKVSSQVKRLKDLERRAESGDTEAMEALLAHSVVKYL